VIDNNYYITSITENLIDTLHPSKKLSLHNNPQILYGKHIKYIIP